jgi:hypothetical protein
MSREGGVEERKRGREGGEKRERERGRRLVRERASEFFCTT